MTSINLRGKLAVITGASSGIGAAAARSLAREGMRVAIIARREERLISLAQEIEAAGGLAQIITADLSGDEGRQAVIRALEAEKVDVLINSAGLGWYGYTCEMPWETALELIQVNIVASLQFTWAFFNRMKAQGYGHIINISSIAGGFPQQGIAMYSASKAFIDNFSTSLHREARGGPVRVSVLRPGPVATEFFDASDQRSGNGLHMPAARLAIPVERVAERIVGLLKHPRRVSYMPGWMCLVPLVEYLFGWLIDPLGPLLLTRQKRKPG